MANEITVKQSTDIFDPQTFQSMLQVADCFSQSGLVPYTMKGKPADVLLVMQMGREMNLKPIQSFQFIDCIKGKPTVKPMGMLALIRMNFPDALIKIEDSVAGEVKVTMGRYQSDTNAYTSTWTIQRASLALLTEKDNWKKQPQTMLKWRAIADAARTVFPDILLGTMTRDEVENSDFIEDKHDEVVKKIQEKKDDIELSEKILKKEKPEEDIGEFVISTGSLKGKKLKDIDIAELLEFYSNAKKHFEDGKVSMSQKDQVLLNVLEMYLQEKELIDRNSIM